MAAIPDREIRSTPAPTIESVVLFAHFGFCETISHLHVIRSVSLTAIGRLVGKARANRR